MSTIWGYGRSSDDRWIRLIYTNGETVTGELGYELTTVQDIAWFIWN